MCDTCEQLKAELRKTQAKVKELTEGHTVDDPVNVDLVKTTKSMFYETALTIFRKAKKAKAGGKQRG